MAEGASYPARFINSDGQTVLGLIIVFTDDSDQPSSSSGPLTVPATGTSVIVRLDNPPDYDPVLAFDGDTGTWTLSSSLETGAIAAQSVETVMAITAGGVLDGDSLGPTISYVTVQAGAPSTYQTPMVLDTTMTTGGLYAWDGSAYQKVALALV